MFPSVAEQVAVVETLSLVYFQGVRGREPRPSLRLNLCYRSIHDAERVQRIGVRRKQSDSSGVKLEGVQDGVI